MRKMKYIIGILLLFMVIGFATVTVTLSITGNAKITSDVDNFKVYFSDVKVNDVQDLTLVKTETELSFNTELASIGNTYEITYDVTNASTMFDAELSINCTEGDEYLSIINEFDTSNLIASTTRTGILTLKKIKSNANETSNEYTITCNIEAIPVERTEEATGTVPSPLEKVYATSDYEVILGDITASPWGSYDGGELETVSATNTLFKPSFLTEAAAVIPKASLLVAYDDEIGETTFESGDLIRVENTRCLTKDNDNKATYVYSGASWQPIDTTDAVYWCEEGGENEFAAYYPATESSSYHMFTIPTVQNTGALLAAADWMTAGTNAIMTPTDKSLSLAFQHMLSKVTIRVTRWNDEYADSSQEITEPKIYSLGSDVSATYNDNGTISNVTSSDGEITAISPLEGSDTSFTAIVAPGVYNSSDKIMELVIDGEDVLTVIAEELPTLVEEGLQPGNHYTFDLTVGGEVLTLDSVQVEDWTEEDIDESSAQQLANIIDYKLVGDTDEPADISVFITGELEDKYNAYNAKWTHDGTEWFSETKTIFENNSSNQKVYALYPYIEEITNNEVSVNIDEQIDFLYSPSILLTSPIISLDMKHILAKISLNITLSDESISTGDTTIAGIQIKNMYSSAVFNVENGDFNSFSSPNATIDLMNNEALLIPIETSEITLVFTFDSGRTKEATVNTPNGLEQGTVYNINIEV